MKKLYLVRHAKSNWSYPELKDFDRPLDERGHRDAPMMAGFIKKQEIFPDLLLTSTAQRALTTAYYFGFTFEIDEQQIQKTNALYHASKKEIAKIIQSIDNQNNIVFLFGHNPGISETLQAFNDTEYVADMSTCAVAHIDLNIKKWSDFSFKKGEIREIWKPKDLTLN
jgi:phosphohistidine phosphatase